MSALMLLALELKKSHKVLLCVIGIGVIIIGVPPEIRSAFMLFIQLHAVMCRKSLQFLCSFHSLGCQTNCCVSDELLSG